MGATEKIRQSQGLNESAEIEKDLQMIDAPRPKTICPECGHREAFFHCALQNDEGDIYDYGTLVTCLKCKTPFNVDKDNA